MKSIVIILGIISCLSGVSLAVPAFSDNFEPGTGTNTWYNWARPGGSWPPSNPSGINNLMTTSVDHNHTPVGSQSRRAWESDPAAWNAYSDFGADSGTIRADVYLFEDYVHPGTDSSQPVTNMLALYGDGANPGVFSDYLQLGVVPFFPGGSQRYGFRTRYNDANGLGFVDTGVSRKSGWTHLAIEVDALASGGQVRFYIDGSFVGSSYRAGANNGAGGVSSVPFRWVGMGNNSKSYENFWYDDVSVTPEPSVLILLLVGAACGAARRHTV